MEGKMGYCIYLCDAPSQSVGVLKTDIMAENSRQAVESALYLARVMGLNYITVTKADKRAQETLVRRITLVGKEIL